MPNSISVCLTELAGILLTTARLEPETLSEKGGGFTELCQPLELWFPVSVGGNSYNEPHWGVAHPQSPPLGPYLYESCFFSPCQQTWAAMVQWVSSLSLLFH